MLSVTLHNFSSLHLPFFPLALQHDCVASVASSGLLVLKGDFKFNLVERKVVPYCTMLIVTFHHVAFLSNPISVFSERGLPLNENGNEKGPVQISMRCFNLWRDNHPSIHRLCPVFLLLEWSRGFVGVDSSCRRAKAGSHPGQATTSSQRWEDHDLLI